MDVHGIMYGRDSEHVRTHGQMGKVGGVGLLFALVDVDLADVEFGFCAEFVEVLFHLEDAALLLIVEVVGAAVHPGLHALESLACGLEAEFIAL